MFEGHRVVAVVPAFREERLILRTLATIPDYVDQVIVVDDASDDATAARATSWGDPRLRIVQHNSNRGVGAAIATGYAHAFDSAADIAVVVAGDAQMDPTDMRALVREVASGRAEYAKGNRLIWPEASHHMPTARWIGNRLFSSVTRVVTGLAVGDSQCGYTALSREGAARMPLDALWPRYGYPNDLLGLAAIAGLRVVDVPVRPVYADEKSGIGLRHALFVVPYVLLRVILRRVASRIATPALPARASR